jgi:drug/metabolite transporter (DMT)-like permease
MKGVLYLILTGFLLGTTGIWIKLIGESISPFLLTFIRTLISALLILFLIIFSKDIKTIEHLRLQKKAIIPFLLSGFFGVAIGFGFYVKAFSYIPVANAIILVYVYPLATTLLSSVFLKEKLTRWEFISLILVVMGIWAVYISEISITSNSFGNFLALTAGVGYAVFIVCMRYFERQGYPYWKVTFWPLFLGGLILLTFLPFEQLKFSLVDNIPIYIVCLSFTSFLGFVFYAKGLKTIEAHNAVIITSLFEPLLAIALAFLILGETLSKYVIISAILIVSANIILGKEYGKKRTHKKC